MRARTVLVIGLVVTVAGPSVAADWPGSEEVGIAREARSRVVGWGCVRGPVPTNSPADPSYVGSSYGLGKPSYYGNPPPLGFGEAVPRRRSRPCL